MPSATRVVFGCGAQARYVIENLASVGKPKPLGLVDLEGESHVGDRVHGIEVRWTCEQALRELDPKKIHVIVAHGDNAAKMEAVNRLKERRFQFFEAIHAKSLVSPTAQIDAGCIINPGAVIGVDARIASHVIVHAGAIIEHDCILGSGCNIGPGVSLAGRVRVGEKAYVYTGSSVVPGVTIGPGAIVGAGSVILKDVASSERVVGNPARILA